MSSEYHKIQSIYKRDRRGVFMEGQWSRPEIGYLANNEWEWTEKVDGTNIRLILDGLNFRIGGRTESAQLPAPLVERIADHGWAEMMRAHFGPDTNVVLYGEGYGAKIQKGGGNYRSDQGFVLFDVRVGRWWLDRENVVEVANVLSMDVVPVVGRGTIHDAIDCVGRGIISSWGDFDAEGVVCRPVVPMFNRKGERIIVKVKGRDLNRMESKS